LACRVGAVPGGVEARGGPVRLRLAGSVPFTCQDGAAVAAFPVAAGETVELRLCYSASFESASAPDQDEPTIADTVEAWESWAVLHAGYDGSFPAEVRRSSLVLQGLTYQHSGAVVAATTSLPERLGGDLNFDYRFAWLRDLSLTIRSRWIAACPDEPSRFFDWFATAAGRTGDELIQIMYGVEGGRVNLNRPRGDVTAGPDQTDRASRGRTRHHRACLGAFVGLPWRPTGPGGKRSVAAGATGCLRRGVGRSACVAGFPRAVRRAGSDDAVDPGRAGRQAMGRAGRWHVGSARRAPEAALLQTGTRRSGAEPVLPDNVIGLCDIERGGQPASDPSARCVCLVMPQDSPGSGSDPAQQALSTA